MKRLLITTALEESWRGEPSLFLGEWCRLHRSRARWEAMDAQLCRYHWDDRSKLHNDYLYLRGLHERLLAELAASLNGIHGVNHSVRYWRIVVGPWLGYFVQMLFDRWSCLKVATEEYEVGSTVVLPGDGGDAVPRDMLDFHRLYVTDEWNHRIYAALLDGFPAIARREGSRQRSAPAAVSASPATSAKAALRDAYSRIATRFVRQHDGLFYGTYLPRADELRLQASMGQWPQLWSSVQFEKAAPDESQRGWLLNDRGETNDFEAAARRLIPAQIPTAYLEGYHSLSRKAETLPWPRQPNFIWTSNAHESDDLFKVWCADKVEKGAPLVIGQHGGHYGTGLWSFGEDHELAVCDAYLSWGWTESRQPKVVPVGQLKAKRPLGVRHSAQPDALLVTCALPRYSYWMYSVFVAGQYLDYFADQARFVAALPAGIRERLLVRIFPADWGWDQKQRWRDSHPDVRIDDGEKSIQDRFRRTRVCIATYNATTFLETFTMEIPTVMFWNPEHWELRPSAIPYFDELSHAGVFHTTPESAASKVTSIWEDSEGWWRSDAVRQPLEKFKARYCRLAGDLNVRTALALRQAARTNRPAQTTVPCA